MPAVGLCAEERTLWSQWRQEGDPAARERLYAYYAPWMRQLAGHCLAQYREPLAEWGDFVHFAAVGLLQAIDRFEPRENTRFQSYAQHYIRGAIGRGLAGLREKGPRQDSERIAHHWPFKVDNEDPVEALIDATVDLAFGYFLELGIPEENPGEALDPYGILAQRQHVDYLRLYVHQLPPRERLLITLHYEDQVPFADIAREFGVSRARITQLHAQALARIRAWFREIDRDIAG